MSHFTNTLHTAAVATAVGPWLDVRDFEAVAIHFVNVGSPVGTVTFEGSLSADKSNVVAVTLYRSGDPTTPVTSTTTPGIFVLPQNHAYYWLRANLSAYTSGAFTVIAARRDSRHRASANTG